MLGVLAMRKMMLACLVSCAAAVLVDACTFGADGMRAGAPAVSSLGQETSAARPSDVPSLVTGVPVPTLGSSAPAVSGAVERVQVVVLAEYPHDPGAFTQGLLATEDGRLLESTGLYGESSLREVDLDSGEVLERQDLPPDLFAEGLGLVGDRLIQLTWREELALVHDARTLELQDTIRYSGEGWGLCYDGSSLVMSDGSSRLTFRDRSTFEPTGVITVTVDGDPIERLNELECVGDRVYANVWQTEDILDIERETGSVGRVIDASGLLSADERESADVLNGIAYRPATDTFLITGKWWPKLFEVRFGPAPNGSPEATPDQ